MKHLIILLLIGSFAYAQPETVPVARLIDGKVVIVNVVKDVPLKVQPSLKTQRVGDGHTHTCANGHTWDHSTTLGHNCPICGLAQYVQDRTPQPVTIVRPITYSFNQNQGGCVNGQCPTSTVRYIR